MHNSTSSVYYNKYITVSIHYVQYFEPPICKAGQKNEEPSEEEQSEHEAEAEEKADGSERDENANESAEKEAPSTKKEDGAVYVHCFHIKGLFLSF